MYCLELIVEHRAQNLVEHFHKTLLLMVVHAHFISGEDFKNTIKVAELIIEHSLLSALVLLHDILLRLFLVFDPILFCLNKAFRCSKINLSQQVYTLL